MTIAAMHNCRGSSESLRNSVGPYSGGGSGDDDGHVLKHEEDRRGVGVTEESFLLPAGVILYGVMQQ